MSHSPKPHILDSNASEIEAALKKESFESYRAAQVLDWIFKRRAASFEAMTNIPLEFRQRLRTRYLLRKLPRPKIEKSRLDQTVKFTFDEGKNGFSCVLLPHARYYSLCLSTQAGCAFRCGFCASGLVAFERNLTSGEILDQIYWAEELSSEKIQNVLFMGMGEPLANFDHVARAIRWMTDSKGLATNPKRITLSTTGLAPKIVKLADEALNINLALSLHAASDELRKKIMPVSAEFGIAEVLAACKYYQTKNSGDFTIEYILLGGVNDSPRDAQMLDQLLQNSRFPKPAKINLIPYNPVPSLNLRAPGNPSVEAFFSFLKKKKYIVHCRKAQGQDIGAACGQLS